MIIFMFLLIASCMPLLMVSLRGVAIWMKHTKCLMRCIREMSLLLLKRHESTMFPRILCLQVILFHIEDHQLLLIFSCDPVSAFLKVGFSLCVSCGSWANGRGSFRDCRQMIFHAQSAVDMSITILCSGIRSMLYKSMSVVSYFFSFGLILH